jgi:PAS domain S-box-containing protein
MSEEATLSLRELFSLRSERFRPLRIHLIVLVLAVLLPALAVGAGTVWRFAETYRHSFEIRLQDTSRALALFVDSEIETSLYASATLASSPLLNREADFSAFLEWAREVGLLLGTSVVVHDAAADFRMVANTALPLGAAFPPPAPPGVGASDVIRRAAETKQPAVSDFFIGRASGRPVVLVAAPVIREGQVTHVVGVSIDPARLSERLHARSPSGQAFVSVADSRGRIISRSRDHDRFVGTVPPSRSVSEANRGRRVFWAQSVYGETALFSAQPLERAPGWSLVVAEPYAVYRKSWLTPLLTLMAGGASLIATGALVAALLARRILRPIKALVRRAEAVASGKGRAEAIVPVERVAMVAEFEALRLASERAEMALLAREAEFRSIFENAAVGVVELDARTQRYLRVNRRFCELVGRTEEQLVGQLGPKDLLHPDDQRLSPLAVAAEGAGEAEAEVRFLRPDGTLAWAQSTASVSARDAEGRPLRTVSVVQDITERRRTEEARALLAREVDHRAKNVLAVVMATVRMTSRSDPESYAEAIEGRVGAMARTHSLLADARWMGADLQTLAEGELRTFTRLQGCEPAIGPEAQLSGPRVIIAAEAAQAMSLVLHELATNAAKYGALSARTGLVRLDWQIDEAEAVLRLRWIEEGGPRVAEPLHRGFGTEMIQATVEAQLGGTVRREWQPRGLVFTLCVPLTSVLSSDGETRGYQEDPNFCLDFGLNKELAGTEHPV